jgi:lipopolysaccharide transport system ATP-binding protein
VTDRPAAVTSGFLGRPPAVVAEGLSKRYSVGGGRVLVPVPAVFGRGARARAAGDVSVAIDLDDELVEEPEDDAEDRDEPERPEHAVWALRRVDLEVASGTALGIVGPNGAGKSTLLKVLARITPPTEGRAIVRGRVAPMIELTAAFLQPDAPARQNIELLARLFGVSPELAASRVGDILEFAELTGLERAPTKRYSSGLLKRLAFSTVLHFEPSVLLADEILGVGDAAFRERCLDNIRWRQRRGLTVLFASHDLEFVRRVCNEVLWLDAGAVKAVGPTERILAEYEAEARGSRRDRAAATTRSRGRQLGRKDVSFSRHAAVLSGGLYALDGAPIETVRTDEEVQVRIEIEVAAAPASFRFGAALEAGKRIGARLVQREWTPREGPGRYVAYAAVPADVLPEGFYIARVGGVVRADGEEVAISLREAFTFEAYAPDAIQTDAEAEDAQPLFHELDDVNWTVAPVAVRLRPAPENGKKRKKRR